MRKKRVIKPGTRLWFPGLFHLAVDQAEERLLQSLNDDQNQKPELDRLHRRTLHRFISLQLLSTDGFVPRKNKNEANRLETAAAVLQTVNKEFRNLPFYPQVKGVGEKSRLVWIQDSIEGRNEDMQADEWSLYLTILQIFGTGRIRQYARCACGCGTWFIKYKPEHTFSSEEHKERSRQTDKQRKAARAEEANKVYLARLRALPDGEERVARLLALRQRRRKASDESHTLEEMVKKQKVGR